MMDRNTILAIVLSLAVLTLWTMFTTPPPSKQRDQWQPAAAAPAEQKAAPAEPFPQPQAARPSPVAPPGEARATPTPPGPPEPPAQQLGIDTPLLRAELESLGGVLSHLELKGFRVTPAP